MVLAQNKILTAAKKTEIGVENLYSQTTSITLNH
jgi:hypothetical protein